MRKTEENNGTEEIAFATPTRVAWYKFIMQNL